MTIPINDLVIQREWAVISDVINAVINQIGETMEWMVLEHVKKNDIVSYLSKSTFHWSEPWWFDYDRIKIILAGVDALNVRG